MDHNEVLDEYEDSNTPGSPGWQLHKAIERAEQKGQDFSRASAELRQRPSPEAADAYLETLKRLTAELNTLQRQLKPENEQEVSDIWRKLTKVITGREQPV